MSRERRPVLLACLGLALALVGWGAKYLIKDGGARYLLTQWFLKDFFTGPVGSFWEDFAIVVEPHGDVVYAGLGNHLGVFDVSDPAAPQRLTDLNLRGMVHGLERDGDLLYAAAGAGGLVAIDISDPRAPVVAERLLTQYAMEVTLEEGRAWVADERAGVAIVERDGRGGLRYRASVYGGYVNHVARSGEDLLFVADGYEGLVAFRGAGDARPQPVGQLDVTENSEPRPIDPSPTMVVLDEERALAYLANGKRGLSVVDVRDPEHMRLVFEQPLGGYVYHVRLQGTHALVSDIITGLHVFDISDPREPRQVARFDTGGQPGRLRGESARAVLADGPKGFLLLDITEPTAPAVLGGYRAPAKAVDLEVAHGRLYVALGAAGIDVFELDALDAPARRIATRGFARRVRAIEGGLICVADVIGGAAIIDPESGTTLSVFDYEEHPWDLVAKGRWLYVAVANHGLSVFDIADPARPRFVTSRTEEAGYRVAAALSGDWLVQGDLTEGLKLFDLTDPMSPQLLADTSFVSAISVAARPPHLFLAHPAKGLMVYDASEPTELRDLATLDLEGAATHLELGGNQASVTTWEGELITVDLSDPAAPRVLERESFAGPLYDVVKLPDGRRVIAAGEAGLFIDGKAMKLAPAAAPAIRAAAAD